MVPALLSQLPDTNYNFGLDWCDNVNRHSTTCVFVFSSSASIVNLPTITQEDLLTSGFLPSGLFERIIGKALIWSQSTSRGGFHLRDAVIHKNLAILQFGSQRFRLITYPQVGCIRVDIDGRAPLAVHDILLEQVQKVISECMKSLVVFTALLYTGTNPPTHDDYKRFLLPSSHGQSEGMMLLPLNVLRDIVISKSVLNRPGGRRLMTEAEVRERYGSWLQIYELLDHYDVFLSYRWNEFDKLLVRGIFDAVTSYNTWQGKSSS